MSGGRWPAGSRLRVTEHTTGEEPFCEVENLATRQVGEFFGSLDEFRSEVAEREGFVIVEEVWS